MSTERDPQKIFEWGFYYIYFLFILWKGIILDEVCPWDAVFCLHIPGKPRRAKLGGAEVSDEEATKSTHRIPWVILAASSARMASLSSQPYLTQVFAPSTWAARCGRIRPSYSAGRAGENEGTPVLPPTSPSLLGLGAVCQDRGAERIRPLGCAGRTWGNSFCVTWVWFYCLVGWLLGFGFLLLLSFPRPFPFIFPPAIRNLFFRLSCWPPCLPYGWGYLRRISQRIAP